MCRVGLGAQAGMPVLLEGKGKKQKRWSREFERDANCRQDAYAKQQKWIRLGHGGEGIDGDVADAGREIHKTCSAHAVAQIRGSLAGGVILAVAGTANRHTAVPDQKREFRGAKIEFGNRLKETGADADVAAGGEEANVAVWRKLNDALCGYAIECWEEKDVVCRYRGRVRFCWDAESKQREKDR